MVVYVKTLSIVSKKKTDSLHLRMKKVRKESHHAVRGIIISRQYTMPYLHVPQQNIITKPLV